MTRLMGDATSSAAAALPLGLDLIAGYDTGTSDIRWTAATWALHAGRAVPVHVDQGGPGAPVYSANVIDVETGAWSPADVPGWIARCTAPVPTVYCNRSTLAPVLATGYRGPFWLAFPGWQPGTPLPSLPAGCRFVAVQNDFRAAYDLSAVLDPAWPLEADMITIPGVPGEWLSVQILSSADGGRQVAIGLGTDGLLWQAVRSAGVWSAPVPV